MGRLIIVIVGLLPLFLSLGARAQEEMVKKSFVQEIGGWSGFGYGNNNKSLPEGSYQVLYTMGHIGCNPFFKRRGLFEQFQIYFEPQYNFVRVVPSDAPTKHEYEFGLNFGFKYIYPFSKRWKVFIYIGTGPHAFSATTERQAPGYLFSDNMGLGVYYFFHKRWALATTFRIRHLSNADTRQPNHGINTDNFLFGVGYHFW